MPRSIDDTAMERSRERLARLLDELAAAPQVSKEHLQLVVQELSSGLEELLVAEEELRVQADELAASTLAIDAERERYGELFEFAPDAYLVTDQRGKILEANGAASRLLGVPARFLESKLLATFVHESARRDLRQLVNELVREPGELDERYVRMRPRDGEPFVAAVRATVRAVSDGEPHIRWLIRDITQRLKLEEEVRFLHSEVELLASLGRVAGLTSEPQSADVLVSEVVQLAADALPDCEVTLALKTTETSLALAAASAERARLLETAEQEQGDGPCGVAIREGTPVRVGIAECRARWPHFAEVAARLGVVSVISQPLCTPGGRRGALNVYAFAEPSEHVIALVPRLADQVTIALANAELYESAHHLAVHLQRALETRGVIEQAKGVLIARQGCSDEQAFDILRRASQRLNRKLRDVAADLVSQVQAHDAPRGQVPSATAPSAKPLDEMARAESASRAAALEARARARAEHERERAIRARAAGDPIQRAEAETHEQARAVHERAAALQRQHQAEMATDRRGHTDTRVNGSNAEPPLTPSP